MKKDWEIKKLGEVLSIKRGGSPRPISKYLTNSPDGLNWIKIADATASDKYIYKTKEKITHDGLYKTRLVNIGDFILSNSMSFGKPYIMKTTGCIHDGWLVLKQNEIKIFDIEFLYYLLSSPYIFNQFNSLAAGSTVRNLNIALVSSVHVPIPPLPEQKRIVDILDRTFANIDKAKANAQQNLKNAKELFDSYLQKVFENKGDNWEEKEWNDLIEIRSGKNQKEVLNPNGKYPILGSAGKIMGYADDFLCEERTTIIGRKGTIDKPLYIKSKFWNVDTAFGLISGNTINPEFLFYFCKNFDFKELDKGTTLPSLVKKDLIKIVMPYPRTIKEQKKIVNKLNNFSSKTKKLESIYQQKIEDLEELKKSILQKAFAGEL